MTLPSRASVSDIVDRVRHAFDTVAGFDGPVVRADGYRAIARPHGVSFSPRGVLESIVGDDAGPELTIRTAAIDGDVGPAAGTSARVVLGNTVQSEVADGVIEHFEARADGVELSWLFRRPVAGDLSITAAVEGMPYAGESSEGHHFAGSDGVPRVRIGRAYLVDARGRRSELLSS